MIINLIRFVVIYLVSAMVSPLIYINMTLTVWSSIWTWATFGAVAIGIWFLSVFIIFALAAKFGFQAKSSF